MSDEVKVDSGLIGKPISELTPAELAQLQSQLSALTGEIDTRQKAVREQAETEVFELIAKTAAEQIIKLAWAKLPKLTLVPADDGQSYKVAYTSTKVKGTGGGKRAAPDINGGSITINKIGIAMGGIAWFRAGGKDYEGIKELVKSLKNPENGESEGERCWDISKKGISASDIVIKYHAEEVTLVFNDSTEVLVKDAVEKMKEARTGTPAS